ncbi:protein NEDD1 [Aplochiton taeniatus]
MEEATRLVSSGDCVKIWDAASLTVLEQFNPHSASHPVAQVSWSSNNQYIATASSIGDKLVVSSLKSSPIPIVELAEGKKQTRVCLSSSSQYLVSGGLDNSVNIWDLKTKKIHRTLKDHKEEVTCVSFNGNDTYVASGSTSGDISLHSITTNLSSKAFGHGTNQPIHDLKYSPLKRSLLGSVSDSGTVVLWDSNTQKELHVFDGAHRAPASGLAFSPSSDLLFVTVGLDKKIICYDTASKIVLRSIRAEFPLTAIDFTPDGTGLVVGSTQGKLYIYDLRNSSAPTKVTAAHKTSVTCVRYQSSHNRHLKSNKVASSKTSTNKRISAKLGSHQPGVQTATSLTTPTATCTLNAVDVEEDPAQRKGCTVEVFSREAEGQPGGEGLVSADKFSRVGRNSLDIFSPVREDYKSQGPCGDVARMKGNGLDAFSREGEGHSSEKISKVGRNSLDIFSPVRDDYSSGALPHRKTPLGNPVTRSYSPLPVFQTPPPIKEEEAPPLAPASTETQDLKWFDKSCSSSMEGERQTTAPSSDLVSLSQPAPPFFTPEPSLRRAMDVHTQLTYGTPLNGTTASKAQGPGMSSAVASSLSERIVETLGAEGGAAPLSSIQIQFIQNMIHETLEDFRDGCHRDIVNLQVEMVRQFYIQLNEIHGLIERYSVNDSLVEEIEKLKEENKRLRTNY